MSKGGVRIPGPGKTLGRNKSPNPRVIRKQIRWTREEWPLVQEGAIKAGKEIYDFQREVILAKCTQIKQT